MLPQKCRRCLSKPGVTKTFRYELMPSCLWILPANAMFFKFQTLLLYSAVRYWGIRSPVTWNLLVIIKAEDACVGLPLKGTGLLISVRLVLLHVVRIIVLRTILVKIFIGFVSLFEYILSFEVVYEANRLSSSSRPLKFGSIIQTN